MPIIKNPGADALRHMYKDKGMSAKEIAAECGVSQGTACAWLRDFGLRKKQVRRPRPASDIPPKEELCRLYVTEDLRAKEVAALYHTTTETVRFWLMGYGIRKDKAARNPGWEALYTMYNREGMTAREIASCLNVSRPVAIQWLHEAGIKKENRGHWQYVRRSRKEAAA